MPPEYGERKGRGEEEAGRTCEHGHFQGAAERCLVQLERNYGVNTFRCFKGYQVENDTDLLHGAGCTGQKQE